MTGPRTIPVWAAAALLAAAGCGKNAERSDGETGFGRGPRDTVISGKVTANGQPLKVGAVVFMVNGDVVGHGEIKPDGRYQAGLVPEGPVKVVYSSRPLPERVVRQMAGEAVGPEGEDPAENPIEANAIGTPRREPFVPPADMLALAKAVEARYGHADKTPLTYTVSRGEQTLDLDFSTSPGAPPSEPKIIKK